MADWRSYWEDIATDIEDVYDQGHPSSWKNQEIIGFISHLESVINDIFSSDLEKAEMFQLVGKDGGIGYWTAFDQSTITRLFRYKSTTGNRRTRDIFAMYLGFSSCDDYLRQRGGMERLSTATKNLISKNLLTPNKSTVNDQNILIPLTITLQDADFRKQAIRDEWMIYELAFLWHGKEPPTIQQHFLLMTKEIEATKIELHRLVDQGHLRAKEYRNPLGVTRFITRDNLEECINKQELERPEFLKM